MSMLLSSTSITKISSQRDKREWKGKEEEITWSAQKYGMALRSIIIRYEKLGFFYEEQRHRDKKNREKRQRIYIIYVLQREKEKIDGRLSLEPTNTVSGVGAFYSNLEANIILYKTMR